MLEQLEDAHGHTAALETDALALPLLLLGLFFSPAAAHQTCSVLFVRRHLPLLSGRRRQREPVNRIRAVRRERALEVGQVGVVGRGVGEGEAAERELD